MKINISYFAALREQAGRSQEVLETDCATPEALYRELMVMRALTLDPDLMKVAVNDSYASMDTPLKEGDTVVFIPPVAGG
ncbi:MAG: molybdopterin converting factor subunit 1 [Verrucomicrobia bacterium]|nr:molybdopterin converting factor subunit 1 [Verrucomicrobiota bacterium]